MPLYGPSGGGGVLVGEVVCASAQGSIQFGSIPQTLRTLRLIISGRGDAAASNTTVRGQFNGDTGANYFYEECYGISTGSATQANASSQTSFYVGILPAATATTGRVGICDWAWHNYVGTTLFKAGMGRLGRHDTNLVSEVVYAYWASTAAITSLSLVPSAGNFDVGTVATLWCSYA